MAREAGLASGTALGPEGPVGAGFLTAQASARSSCSTAHVTAEQRPQVSAPVSWWQLRCYGSAAIGELLISWGEARTWSEYLLSQE